MKKKKRKVNKKKFLSRIFVLLILVILIIIVTKGHDKKEEPKFETAVIIKNENVTNSLEHAPYINKDSVLYLSVSDVMQFFDKNIYFEEETNKIITTSETKVAALDVINNILELNSATLVLSAGVLDYGDNICIPISELSNIYNIETHITEKSAIISSLNDEFITIKTTKKTSLKEETSGFSKTIKKLETDEELIYIGEAEKKNWIKVLSYDGSIGYIKNSNITEKEYKRMAMEEIGSGAYTKDIANSIEVNSSVLSSETLANFTERKNVTQNIISEIISSEKFTVNVNLKDVNVEQEKIERFIIELIPRLREIGANLSVTNNNVLSSAFLEENGIS